MVFEPSPRCTFHLLISVPPLFPLFSPTTATRTKALTAFKAPEDSDSTAELVLLHTLANLLNERGACGYTQSGGMVAANLNGAFMEGIGAKSKNVVSAMAVLLSNKQTNMTAAELASSVMTRKGNTGSNFFKSGGDFIFVAKHNGLTNGEAAFVDATHVMYQDKGSVMICDLRSKAALP